MSEYIDVCLSCFDEDEVGQDFDDKVNEVFGYSEVMPDLWFGLAEKYNSQDFDEAIKEASKLYPDKIFTLHFHNCHGDEWQVWVKNGKEATYEPEIIWPTFNERDLK